MFFLLYNMVRVFFLITNITIYYFGYSGYSVSMKIINSRYAFAPQGWELKFFNSQRHYFANKGPSSQSYGFSINHVWMWELDYKESWVLKNWWFWTVCWRRLLRLPWTAKRSNQSILKEVSPEYSLEGLMLKLKLQYLAHLMQRTDSFEKTVMLGKIEGRRRRG